MNTLFELENVHIFDGLSIQSVENKIKLSQTYHKLYSFVDNYMPVDNKPDTEFAIEEYYTFTEDLNSMQCSGVSSTLISLLPPWTSPEANFEYAKQKSQTNDKVDSYYTLNILSRKIELSTDYSKLIVDEHFVQAIENAIRGNERSVNGYRNLVNILNEYGWYIPTKCTLGGSLCITKKSKINNLDEAKDEWITFSNKFGNFPIIHNNKLNGNSDGIETFQIGGYGNGINNYDEWLLSLDAEQNWKIIRYDAVIPSLILLNGKYSQILSTCLRLLIKYYNYSEVISLQPYIDVKDYESKIAYEVNPRY